MEQTHSSEILREISRPFNAGITELQYTQLDLKKTLGIL